LTAKIEDEHPDVIVMSGDIADDKMPHEGTIELLKWISTRYDRYYVTGNHEFWSGDVDAVATLLGIGHVPAEDVVQSPKLLKKK
jgi:predicted MPP superfamily phosphohydrolase